MTHLFRDLLGAVSDPRDIEYVLSAAVGGSGAHVERTRVEYRLPDAGRTLFAVAVFRSGAITDVEPGPALQSPKAQRALVEAAREESALTHGETVTRRALFSARQLKGHFEMVGLLRLSPCPPMAPLGKGLSVEHQFEIPGRLETPFGPPFPLVLEAVVHKSPNGFIQSTRTLRTLDEYQHLLSVLLGDRLLYAHMPSERAWTAIWRENRMEYHLLRGGFDFGESGEADAFLVDGTPEAVLYDGPDYYNRLWFADRELLLPSSLANDVTAYRFLSNGDRRAFARSCYWFAAGLQLASGGFEAIPAFVTSVEALLPKQSGTPCEKCRKLDGPGYRQRFRDFLDRYSAIPPELEPVQRVLYDVRSDELHPVQ